MNTIFFLFSIYVCLLYLILFVLQGYTLQNHSPWPPIPGLPSDRKKWTNFCIISFFVRKVYICLFWPSIFFNHESWKGCPFGLFNEHFCMKPIKKEENIVLPKKERTENIVQEIMEIFLKVQSNIYDKEELLVFWNTFSYQRKRYWLVLEYVLLSKEHNP